MVGVGAIAERKDLERSHSQLHRLVLGALSLWNGILLGEAVEKLRGGEEGVLAGGKLSSNPDGGVSGGCGQSVPRGRQGKPFYF